MNDDPQAPEAIAVTGMAGRFPDAENPDEFWKNLIAGRDGVSRFPSHTGADGREFLGTEGTPGRKQYLLTLSAESTAALDAMALRLADYLENDSPDLADVSYTLATGRRAFPHRRTVVAANLPESVAKLRETGSSTIAPATTPRVAFLFPGEGSQYHEMGREVYNSEPTFRAAVDECAALLVPLLRHDVRSTLYSSEHEGEVAGNDIHRSALTQSCIFTIEYAMAKLWISWGIPPALLIGHDIGEYVAAVLAGTFKLEDALHLLTTRARLMQELPTGGMLAVSAGAEQLTLPEGIDLAAINSTQLVTLSGSHEAIAAYQKELEAREIGCHLLKTSHAIHSAMMEPIVAGFTEDASMIPANAPNIPWISTCTGKAIDAATLADPGYWARLLRQTIRFSEALTTVFMEKDLVILEVGPGQALAPFARQYPDCGTTPVISTLPTSSADLADLIAAAGELWKCGATLDWAGFFKDRDHTRLHLPSYPFERQSDRINKSGEPEVVLTERPATPLQAPSPARHLAPDTPVSGSVIPSGEQGGLTELQQKGLNNLIARYVAKTPSSKAFTAEHRSHYADPQAVYAFKSLWKEMIYPIVSAGGKDARIRDIDGNEYVDITMGFGDYFFGHSPDWLVDAVEKQLRTAVEIGPQSPIAGKLAKAICELTGMERATFCNSGSEAAMVAMRLARTVNFGVEADMATYGKVIGGGRKQYMDALDGGAWNYGDDSFPEVEVTFCAGTFVRHPLPLAAAWRVVEHLMGEGPRLQIEMEERVGRFCRTLNEYFDKIEVAIRLRHFGDLAVIEHAPDLKYASLLWYFLRENGVHAWEGSPLYFTTAHTDEELDRVIKAFTDSVTKMQAAGFLPASHAGTVKTPVAFPRFDSAPTTGAQREISHAAQMGREANGSFNESNVIHLEGELDTPALRAALNDLVVRHPALRSTFSEDGLTQFFHPSRRTVAVMEHDFSSPAPNSPSAQLPLSLIKRGESSIPFDLTNGPVIRIHWVKVAAGRHELLFTAHHPPLFCIHGGDGGVIFYRNQANCLAPGIPLHAIESLELCRSSPLEVASVEQTAAAYVSDLLAFQPHGPFRLAGYSFGGVVAHAMACRLVEMGHTVDFLGLFGTSNPTAPHKAYSFTGRMAAFWKHHAGLPLLQRISLLRRRIREGIATSRRVREEILTVRSSGPATAYSDLRRLQVREENWRAMQIYQPSRYPGRITLFKAMTASDKTAWPDDYGWSEIAGRGLEIIEVPGSHLALFVPGNVEPLANSLHLALSRITEPPAEPIR